VELEGHSRTDATLEPLEDYLVVEPLDESETSSGLIVPINEAAQTRTGIVASVGPDVIGVEPGDKVLYPRDAGYEVRLARSPVRLRVIRREDLIARVHDCPSPGVAEPARRNAVSWSRALRDARPSTTPLPQIKGPLFVAAEGPQMPGV